MFMHTDSVCVCRSSRLYLVTRSLPAPHLDNRDTPLATVNRTRGSTAVSTFDGSLPPAKVKQRQSIPAINRSLFYGKFTVA